MWINDKVTYTPEIVTVSKGRPVEATVEAVGTDGMLAIRLESGQMVRVDSRLCKPA